MRKLLGIVFGLFLCLVMPIGIISADYPVTQGYLQDSAHLLSSDASLNISQTLQDFNTKTGDNVIVMTIPTTGSQTLEQFAASTISQWGLGQKYVVLFISEKERRLMIAVGDDLKGQLPMTVVGQIRVNDMQPKLQKNDYDGGITNGVSAVIATLTHAPYAMTPNPVYKPAKQSFTVLIIVLAFLLAGLILIMSPLRKLIGGKQKTLWVPDNSIEQNDPTGLPE